MDRTKFVGFLIVSVMAVATTASAQPSAKSICDIVMAQVTDRVQANDRRSMDTLKPIATECLAFLEADYKREAGALAEKLKARTSGQAAPAK